jgi:hypothetical protein
MRSFADYRKKELKKTIHSLSFSECMSNSFDILRLDLLEAVKLPELLFENSLVTNSIYESARKGDYQDNKQIIDFLVGQCKSGFYQEIMQEANDPNLLVIQVKELIQSLRDSIGSALKASRPVGGNGEDVSGLDPSYDSESGFAQAANWDAEQKRNKWTNRHSSPDEYDDEQDLSADQGDQSQNPVQGFSNFLQQNRGQQQSPASSPAQPRPSGQPQSPGLGIRPKDGYWAGIKRSMIDPAKDWIKSKWQNFKKRWHNQGLGEHSSLLENVMLENFDSIMDILDKFEVDLLALINKIPPTTSSSSQVTPSDAVPVNPRGSVVSNSPASTDPVTNDRNAADVLNAIPDEVEPNPQEAPLTKTDQVKEDNIIKGAIKGAAALGINLNVGNRIRTSSKVRPENFLDQDGKPIGSGYKSVVFAIANLIKDKIEPEFEKAYRAKKSQEKGRNYNQLTKTDILPLVLQWLNLPKSGLKNLSVSMLDFYNRKVTGTPTEKLTSYNPSNATEPSGDVTEPMGSNAPAAANSDATEPMGSAVPVTTANRDVTEPMGSAAPVNDKSNVAAPMGANVPVTGRPKKSKQSKVEMAIDLFKKNHPEFLDFFLSQVVKGGEDQFASAISNDPHLNHKEVSPEEFVSDFVNTYKDEYESYKSSSAAKNTDAVPSDSPAPTSNVAPEQSPQMNSAKSTIQKILSANNVELDLSKIDDKTLETIVGSDDSSTPEGEENIMNRLLGVLESPNEPEPEVKPFEKLTQSPTVPEATPIQPNPEEVNKSQQRLRGKAGKLAKAQQNGANASLEVPAEVPQKEEPLDQEAVNAANEKLADTDGYGALERDFRKFFMNNEPDRDEDEAWEEINNKILKHVIAGKNPSDVLRAARVTLQKKIKEADDRESSETTGNVNSDGKDPAAGWKSGKVLNDKNMKKEGFNRVLDKFLKLIHS